MTDTDQAIVSPDQKPPEISFWKWNKDPPASTPLGRGGRLGYSNVTGQNEVTSS